MDKLLREANEKNVEVCEMPLSPRIKGLYGDGVIWINQSIPTRVEKRCILAEEMGHYHTSSGDITNQKDIQARKQEKRARNWAYGNLVSLQELINAYKAGVRNRYELAEYLDVIEEFLDEAIKHYQQKYGLYTSMGKYTIFFEPLGVLEMFE